MYAPPGYLVFVREGTLAAAPFDLAAGRVTGPPVADRRGRRDGRPVLLRGHFRVGRRDACGTTTAGRSSSRFEHRSMRNCIWSIAAAVSRAGSRAAFSSFMALNPVGSRTLATAISTSAPARRTCG